MDETSIEHSSDQNTDQDNPADSASDNLPPSKSARKREMTALQKLGESLIELPSARLAQLPLSNRLREAFELAKSLKQREAKRRQLQYIGKLMRKENHQEISASLARFEDDNRLFRQRFQRLEKIRDELIDGDAETLEALLDHHPELDRQHLRQLIRQARKAPPAEATTARRRKLFEYLRENLTDH